MSAGAEPTRSGAARACLIAPDWMIECETSGMDDETPAAPAPASASGGRHGSMVNRLEEELLPAWRRPAQGENRFPVVAAIVLAAVLQILLPGRFTLLPLHWLLPVLELVLLATLTAINPIRLTRHTPLGRYLSLALLALISLDNGASAVLLDSKLISGTAGDQAGPLLGSASAIYLTNLIAFGVLYWEFDRGGPFARAEAHSPYPDFLFPQMAQHHLARQDWVPQFGDYLYVSFTNATAFSPTDTMPLTRWAKLLMAVQSAIALSTTALVIARAVNILK
jgi:hypothetical protein